MAANQVLNSVPKFGAGASIDLFQRPNAGRPATVIDPATLAAVTATLTAAKYVAGETFHTATKAETDAFNDRSASTAKSAGKEAPKPRSILGMAEANARKEANLIEPYVQRAIDTNEAFNGNSYSLRFANQGTDDAPKVLWAFVLVTKRVRAAKETAVPTAAGATVASAS